jgi:hypothetical protein
MRKNIKNTNSAKARKKPVESRKDNNMIEWRERGGNDPKWYAQSSAIVRDVASLPYGYPLGGKHSLGEYTPELNKYGLPGIMSLHFAPTFGDISDINSPINVASHQLYQFVRHVNSGSANYDPNDLMLYVLTIEQLYMWMAYIRRMYLAMYTYAYENKYYPAALVQACGGDYSDLVTHIAQLREFWNVTAAKINAFAVPRIFPVFDRHIQLVSEVYADANTSKAQLYVFKPELVYQFALDANGAGSLIGGSVQLTSRESGNAATANDYSSGNGITFSDIVYKTNQLLQAFYSMEDFGTMTGDILKAYPASACWQLPELTANERLHIGVDMEMLNQIQNASLMGSLTLSDITQDLTNNVLKQTVEGRTPYFTHNGANYKWFAPNAFLANRYLNVDLENVTPEDTLTATRLMNIGENYNEATGKFEIHTQGTEIVAHALIWRYNYSSGNVGALECSRAYFTSLCNLVAIGASDTGVTVARKVVNASNHNMLNLLSNFESHPAIYNTIVVTEAQTNTPSFTEFNTFDSVAFDLGKYTVVDGAQLRDMSSAACERLLGISGI